MPRLKTKKSARKRFHITGGKKFLRRYSMQDHFNARERGKDIRAKRHDKSLNKTKAKAIRRLLPYC